MNYKIENALEKWKREQGSIVLEAKMSLLIEDIREESFKAGWKAAMSSLTPPNVEDEWP